MDTYDLSITNKGELNSDFTDYNPKNSMLTTSS